VALLLKARVPHALVEANDLIDPLMGFIHPTADCAVLLLALSGLDMLAQVRWRMRGTVHRSTRNRRMQSFNSFSSHTTQNSYWSCSQCLPMYNMKSRASICLSSFFAMLAQRPTILHRFYHSDRLPALFYVSFVADFDVQV
jgi:hypothetical protein